MAVVSIKNSSLSEPAKGFSFQESRGPAPVLPVPVFSSATTSSYSVSITGYDPKFTYTVSANEGTPARTDGNVTVSGLTANQSSTLTVTASNPNNDITLTANVPFLSLPAAPTLSVSNIGGTSFDVVIGNYDANLTYTVSSTEGSAARTGGTVSVTGLTGGQSSTISITASNASGSSAAAEITGTSVPPPVAPILSESTGTATSRNIIISNYDSSYTYNLSTSAGSANRSDDIISISLLNLNQSFTLTVSAENNSGESSSTQIASRSLNFSTWTSRTSFSVQTFNISYGNSLWLASGGNTFNFTAASRVSTDATTWSNINTNFGFTVVRGFAYGNGLWVAVGEAGQIRTSTNTTTWTTVNSNFGNTNIDEVAYGNGLWIASAQSNQIRTSTNGSTWVTSTIPLPFSLSSGHKLYYVNDKWFASQINSSNSSSVSIMSTNGASWTTVSTGLTGSTQIESIAYGDGVWVISAGAGQIRYSTDTVSWSSSSVGTQSSDTPYVAYGDGIWLALTVETFKINKFTSTNGIIWENRSMSFGQTLFDRNLVYGNGIWAAAVRGNGVGQIETATLV